MIIKEVNIGKFGKLENQKLVIQNLHSQIDPHFFLTP